MIHLLATGGTIAMRRSATAGGNVPALSAAELLELVGDLPAGPVRVEDWERLPGVHRGPAELDAMRNRVAEIVSSPNPPAGVVITHGTDTIEETAYLLARTLPAAVPVVVTGAMRTSSDPDWDGPRNLRDAIRVAADPASHGRGALVVFAGLVLDGLEAVKLDSFSPVAFGAPHAAPLGAVSGAEVRYDRAPDPARRPMSYRGLAARVAIVPLTLGDDGALLELACTRYDGVVIEGYGRGNIPPGALPAVRRWLAAGKPVVLASRCPFGEVGGEYAFEGGGGQLLRMGVLPAGRRPPSIACLELALCLSSGAPYGGAAA